MADTKAQSEAATADDHADSLLDESGAMDEGEHLDEEIEGIDENTMLDDAEKAEGENEELYDEEVQEDETVDEDVKPGDELTEDKSETADKDKTEGDEKKEEDDDVNDNEDEAEEEENQKKDPNEVPQVNVSVLAKRQWQIKVYPLKADDFLNGQIARVFSNAKESLLYILGPGRNSGGKGEMYISSEVQAFRVVQNLMKLDFKSQEVNIEIIKKSADDGIEEKAFMRFDTKLVRILCVPVFGARRVGNKREQIIGSVFVKNLPNGTSKDMLRVMFPFAPEINFNPEKFKDGTARLVLSTRSAVAPCLKAFTKVELGGKVLELRPLQRKKRSEEPEKPKPASDKKESTAEEDDKETPKKSPSSKSTDTKRERKDSKDEGDKTSSRRSQSAGKETQKSRSHDKKGHGSRDNNDNRRRRNLLGNRGDGGNFRNRNRGSTFGQQGVRNRFRTGSNFGNRNRPDDRRMRTGLPRASGDLGISTEAAKEMLLLQSQLSLAVKNQMAMLSQTQIALEQAKREAAGLSLAREMAQASSSGLSGKHLSDQYGLGTLDTDRIRRGGTKAGQRRGQDRRRRSRDQVTGRNRLDGSGGDHGYKRNAGVAALSDYSAGGFGKRRNTGQLGHGESSRWNDDRSVGGFAHPQVQHFGYGVEREVDDREADFMSLQAGSLQSNLSYSSGGYGYRY